MAKQIRTNGNEFLADPVTGQLLLSEPDNCCCDDLPEDIRGCCLPDGSCLDLSVGACIAASGVSLQEGESCTPGICGVSGLGCPSPSFSSRAECHLQEPVRHISWSGLSHFCQANQIATPVSMPNNAEFDLFPETSPIRVREYYLGNSQFDTGLIDGFGSPVVFNLFALVICGATVSGQPLGWSISAGVSDASGLGTCRISFATASIERKSLDEICPPIGSYPVLTSSIFGGVGGTAPLEMILS